MESRTPASDTISGPTLLTIPLEIRLQIFKEVFQSTIMYYGYVEHLESDFYSLALLYVNRQVSREAASVSGFVVLDFASTDSMLRKLLPLSPAERGRFKYLRVNAFPVCLHPLGTETVLAAHLFDTAIRMLPGLQLDIMCVRDVYHGDNAKHYCHMASYAEVSKLLCTGGWRRLLYFSPSGQMLGWKSEGLSTDPKDIRPEQPSAWNQQFRNEDGGLDPTIRVFRGRRKGSEIAAGDVAHGKLNPQQWEPYTAAQGYLEALMKPSFEEGSRPLLVEARRADGVDCVESGVNLQPTVHELLKHYQHDWRRVMASKEWINPELNPHIQLVGEF